MIQIVYDPIVPKEVMAKWVIDRLGDEELHSVERLGNYVAIGVLKDKKPVCVVIYNFFRPLPYGNDMHAIIASENPSWCLPGVLRELFRYPFEHAGCERLTAVIRDGNSRSLKLCQGLGFRKEGVLRRAYNGKTNAILIGMLKSECKWLHRGHKRVERPNGKKERLYADAAGSC